MTLAAFVASTDAQAAMISINQPKIELELSRGETYSGETTVENPTEETLDLKMYLEDWQYKGNGTGEKDFSPPKTTPLSASGWITFSPADAKLAPFGKQTIRYTVHVPEDAEGGHYSVLFFESMIGSVPDDSNPGAMIRVAGRIGALFFIRVKDTIRREGLVESLKVTPPQGNSPMELETTFKNTGNIDVTLEGNFLIMSADGQVLGRGDIDKVYTFPGETDTRKTQWVGRLPKGDYDLLVTYDMGAGQAIVKEEKISVA